MKREPLAVTLMRRSPVELARRVGICVKVLREWKRRTQQIDNGNCAVCGQVGRLYGFHHRIRGGTSVGVPKQCPNRRCFSRIVDDVLRGCTR